MIDILFIFETAVGTTKNNHIGKGESDSSVQSVSPTVKNDAAKKRERKFQYYDMSFSCVSEYLLLQLHHQ